MRKTLFGLLILSVILSSLFLGVQKLNAEEIEITNVQVSVTDTEAVITWTTNIYSLGWVDFDIDANYNYRASEGSTVRTSHSVTLNELLPETLYHFKVSAKAGDNIVSTFDQTFETDDEFDETPPKISDFRVAYVSGTTVTLQWRTNENSNTYVDYGNEEGEYTRTEGSSKMTTVHDITIDDLNYDHTYYFQIRSEDKKDNTAYFKHQTFRTEAFGTIENAELKISNIRPVAVNDEDIGYTYANLSWRTSKVADTVIYYGTHPDRLRRKKAEDVFRDYQHSYYLDNLEPDTTYYFKVESTDVFGVKKTSSVNSFLTKDDVLRISSVYAEVEAVPLNTLTNARLNKLLEEKVIDINDNQTRAIRINWELNRNAFCKVLYKTKRQGQEFYNYIDRQTADWLSGSNYSYIYAPVAGEYKYKVVCLDNEETADEDSPRVYSEEKTYEYSLEDNLLDDSVVKTDDDADVFYIKNGNKYWVKDVETLLGRNWQAKIEIVDDTILKQYPLKGTIYGKFDHGDVVKSVTSDKVYMIEYNYKRPIASPAVFLGLGYNWSDIRTATAEELAYYQIGQAVNSFHARIRNGSLIKAQNNNTVYLVDDGMLRPFYSAEAYLDNFYDWSGIAEVPDERIQAMPVGEMIY